MLPKLLLLFFFLFLLCDWKCVSGEEKWEHGDKDPNLIFVDPPLSVHYVTRLAKAELEIYNILVSHRKNGSTCTNLNRYLSDFNSVSGEEISHNFLENDWKKAIYLSGNPNILLRMLIRMVRLLQPFLQELEGNKRSDVMKVYDNLGIRSPSEEDIEEQLALILYIHAFYGLDPTETANGKFLERMTKGVLKPSHLLEIGELGLDLKIYTSAFFFLKASLKINEQRSENGFSQQRVKAVLRELIRKHNDILEQERENGFRVDPRDKEFHFSAPLPPSLGDPLPPNFDSEFIKWHSGNRKGMEGSGNYRGPTGFYTHRAVCRGADYSKEDERRKLFCFLDTSKHPFFLINPVKTEVLSLDPFVALLHSVFLSGWMDKILAHFSPKEENQTLSSFLSTGAIRETVVIPKDLRGQDFLYRIKGQRGPFRLFVDDERMDEKVPLKKRTEMLTGLHVLNTGSDPLMRINVHLMGSGTVVHIDQLRPEVDEIKETLGKRLMSILYPMSEVEIGGGLAFPYLGFNVKHKLGDAILWSVETAEGEPEYRTAHDGCPSIIGHRHVGVRFIREFKNIFNRKCSTEKGYWLDDLLIKTIDNKK